MAVGAAVVGMLGFVLFRDDSPGSARPTPEPTATASLTTTGRPTTLTVATTTTVPAIVAQVDATDMKKRKDFVTSDDLKKIMADSGVEGKPEITFFELVEIKRYDDAAGATPAGAPPGGSAPR